MFQNGETGDPKCPKCGQKGKCSHLGDIGAGEEYWDLYEFQCANPDCGYKDSQTVFGGRSSWDNWFTQCPYCGYQRG